MELTLGSSLPVSVHKCWLPFMRVHFHSWEAVVRSSTVVFVHGGRCGGSWLSMGGHVIVHGHGTFMGGSWSSVGTRYSWHGGSWWSRGGVFRGHFRFVSRSPPWALDVCGWVAVVINGGVICVVLHLWAVGVVRVGVIFIHLRAVVVVRGCPCVGGHFRLWAVVVVWVVFILVGGRRPWVLLLREGWWWVMVVFLSLSFLVVLGCGCSWC